ncbi:hypothetical protein ACT29H_10415 [Thermophagus sp. OGC60D27]|uniref:hypothetical protein n=1 Tax=Thermophagus sp. OGC60D27 TaxID=3458415 RepID=UPI00403808E1
MKLSLFIGAVVLMFWAGAVCAISFMEAWIKFQAPGVTLPIGLSIGMRVFRALNLVEWILATGYVVVAIREFKGLSNGIKWFSGVVLVILIIQSFALLPSLAERALRIIDGETLPASPLHIIYVVLELIKVVSLVILSFKWFLNANNSCLKS